MDIDSRRQHVGGKQAGFEGRMAEMTGGQAVTETLLRHGVTTIYGLPGVQSDHLFNAFHDAGSKLSVVHTRHEQGAAYMALGAALATGQPAVYSVVPGPGFLNSAAALSTAFATNAPVLALVGQIPSASIGKGFGLLHEIPDQSAMIGQLTKWSTLARSPQQAATGIAEAWRAMISGRPRPVGLELPPDILGSAPASRFRMRPPRRLRSPTAPCSDRRDAAVRATAADRGRQRAIAAAADVVRLSECSARRCLPTERPRIVDDRTISSSPPAAAVWRTPTSCSRSAADCRSRSRCGARRTAQIIRLEIDPTELERYAPSEIAIAGDARRAIALPST